MKNIIENRRSESLNPNILKILDNPNCRTSEKMMNILIGKPEKSQLTLCDYKHIEKEINKACSKELSEDFLNNVSGGRNMNDFETSLALDMML